MEDQNDIIDRLLDPIVRILTPDVARKLIALRADPVVQQRVDELAELCNDGKLSEEERDEYETIVRISNILAILNAKTKRVLAHDPSQSAVV